MMMSPRLQVHDFAAFARAYDAVSLISVEDDDVP